MASNQLRAGQVLGYLSLGNVLSATTTLTHGTTSLLGFGFVPDRAVTLNKVRIFLSTVTGVPAAGDMTCTLFNDSSGLPGTTIATSTTTSPGTPAAGWIDFTGFSAALSADTQYWAGFDNHVSSSSDYTVQYGQVGAAPYAVNSSGTTWGWRAATKPTTTWSSAQADTVGFRLAYADGSFDGCPVQSITGASSAGTTERAFGKQEVGALFTTPAGAILNVRGVAMPITKNGAPGNLRFRIYNAAGLMATTNSILAANVTSGGHLYVAHFSSQVQLQPSTAYRVVAGDATAADTSANSYGIYFHTWDSDVNSLALTAFEGSWKETSTTDNTVSPPTWTQTAANMPGIALLLDTTGEFSSAGGAVTAASRGMLTGGRM